GGIVHANVKKKEDGKEVVREAVRQGKRLRITTKQGGRTLTRDVDLPKDTLAQQRQSEDWLRKGMKAGGKFTKYSVAWEEADVDQKEIYVFKERKTILWGGLKTVVLAVEVDVNGGKLKAEVLPDGRLLTAVLGGLLTVRLEKEATAKKLDAIVDLMPASSI